MARITQNRQQARKLEDYVLSAWPEIETQRPRLDQFVTQHQGKVGFTFSKSNLIAAVSAVGRSWPLPARGKGYKIKRTSVKQFLVLTRAVVRLYSSLEGSVPTELLDLEQQLASQADAMRQAAERATPPVPKV